MPRNVASRRAKEALDERETLETKEALEARESAYTVYDPRGQSPLGEIVATDTGLVITVLDDDEFRAGWSFTIRIMIEDSSGKKPKPSAEPPSR